MSPAFNFREVTVLREPFEVFRGQLSGCDAQSGELLADERVSLGMALLKRSNGGLAIDSPRLTARD